MNNKLNPSPDTWLPCQQGTISVAAAAASASVSAAAVAAGRRALIKTVLFSAAGVLLIGGLTGWAMTSGGAVSNAPSAHVTTEVNCVEVNGYMNAYVGGLIGDQTLIKKIDDHVADCCTCNKKVVLARAKHEQECKTK